MDDRFALQRGNDFAENLSEGGRLYLIRLFLVTLDVFTERKKRRNNYFIDDPIPSLDANHIAQIYSLINSRFFRKGEDLLQPEAAINCFKQLFISTHNFEFFSFLKDSSQLNKYNSNPKHPLSLLFYLH
ncbi:MAG: AAA family ATPase [Bacteroidetes bacterium]|nr:AAA family ATPase [Bacteroidota bacterium]